MRALFTQLMSWRRRKIEKEKRKRFSKRKEIRCITIGGLYLSAKRRVYKPIVFYAVFLANYLLNVKQKVLVSVTWLLRHSNTHTHSDKA